MHDAWFFAINDGVHAGGGKFISLHTLAVRPGAVAAAVPLPAALPLMLAA